MALFCNLRQSLRSGYESAFATEKSFRSGICKSFGGFFTTGSYTRRIGLGQPNKSGEKSFDIKIVSPSRRPTNKLFFDQTLHLMIIMMMMTGMILTILLVIRMIRMMMMTVVENR